MITAWHLQSAECGVQSAELAFRHLGKAIIVRGYLFELFAEICLFFLLTNEFICDIIL